MDFEPPLIGCVVSDRDFLQHPEIDERMRDQHSDGGISEKSCGLREHLGPEPGQVQGLPSHDDAGLPSPCAAHQGVLREPRMQGCGFEHGHPTQFFYPSGGQSLG